MPRKKSSDKDVKKRNWAFVLYPESAPADWRLQLEQSGLPCVISPLHDKDVYEDGEHKGLPKKSHHHIILVYGSPTTFKNVEGLTKRLNQPIPIPLDNIRGMYRYLTHMDHPDKYQYSAADIRTLNGFDIGDFVEMTKSEVTKVKRALADYIVENDIREYADLIEMTMCEGVPPEWFDIASSQTMFFTGFLKSRHYRATGKG